MEKAHSDARVENHIDVFSFVDMRKGQETHDCVARDVYEGTHEFGSDEGRNSIFMRENCSLGHARRSGCVIDSGNRVGGGRDRLSGIRCTEFLN
jgi:hypothetical protein